MTINIIERRNLTYLGFVAYVLSFVFRSPSQNQTLTLIGCFFAATLMMIEIFLLLRGGKKDIELYKVFFNPNGRINNIPVVFFSVFCGLGVGFVVLGTCLYFLKHFEPNLTISLFILVVAVYLISNCLIYYLFLIMFKKREFKLEDLIK